LESKSGRLGLTFADLRQRLLLVINRRINNGEFSERGLARIVGISQPQVHNVLKGARSLTPETADLLLEKLGISLLELLTAGEVQLAANLELFPERPSEEVNQQPSGFPEVSLRPVRKSAAAAAGQGSKSLAS
jgi:plasmid maintenance system antidote protein VapI